MAGLSEKTLERMLNDSKFSDIILLSSDGQEFHAATKILQSNCPYFMVAQNLEKAVDGKLALDIRGKILAEVRSWIYTKVIDVQKFDFEDFLDLFSIADSYGLEDLSDKAEDFLMEYALSEDNVLKIFERADKVDDQELIKSCVDYWCEYISSLLQNPKVFSKIPSDLILEINRKVSLHKIPNYYQAIGKWAKVRPKALARKVLQETLNIEEMPKEMLVDMVETMLLKNDDIVTEQMIHTLTSDIALVNSSTFSIENQIKLENIEKIIWNIQGQVKEIPKEKFSKILNTEPRIWFDVERCFNTERQLMEIFLKQPFLLGRLSWRLDFLTHLNCVDLFEKNGEKVCSAISRIKVEKTAKFAPLKLTWENPRMDSRNQLCEVALKKPIRIHRMRFEFSTNFKIKSLLANCTTT